MSPSARGRAPGPVPSSRRRGFTLLEVMVAIVVGSVVALLAYATLRAGVDTGERVGRAADVLSADAVVRSALIDALRHLPEGGGTAMEERLFTLEDRSDPAGAPDDRLSFVSYGVGPAPGTTGAWAISIGGDRGGVLLHAAPLDPLDLEDGASFDLRLPAAAGLSARAAGPATDGQWVDAWDFPGRVPAAVELTLLDRAGRPTGPPLVVQTSLERVP